MTTDIIMPNLGFDTQEGKLVEWLKQPGDPVAKGEPIAIIESDKANVELESVAGGLLIELLFTEGDDVLVGAVIARVNQEDEKAKGMGTSSTPVAAIHSAANKIEASPIAKRLASEHEIDLINIKGSGRHGRIKRSDVEAYLSSQVAEPSGNGKSSPLALPKVRKAAREAGINLVELTATGSRGEVTLADLNAFRDTLSLHAPAVAEAGPVPDGAHEVALSRVRQVIGKRLGASKREAPHFYVTGEFDLETALLRLKNMPEPQPRFNDLIQYLTVQTLRQVPELNATYEDGHLFNTSPSIWLLPSLVMTA